MRKLSILVIGAMVALIAGLAFATSAFSTHAVPRTGTPLRVPIVPRFKECRSTDPRFGNAAHSPPLPATTACSPPQLQATQVTLGTNNTNGRRVGVSRLDVCTTTQSGVGTGSNCEALTLVPPVLPTGADVRLRGNSSDIICSSTSSATTCPGGAGSDYNPAAGGPYACGLQPPTNTNKQYPSITVENGTCNPSVSESGIPCLPNPPNPATCNAGEDMIASADIPGSQFLPTGGTGAAVRISDHWNDANPPGGGFVDAATVVDQPVFPVPVACSSNSDATLGSYCGTNTTANALIDGVTDDFKQAVVEIGEVQISAAGSCGNPSACPEIFGVQGIMIP